MQHIACIHAKTTLYENQSCIFSTTKTIKLGIIKFTMTYDGFNIYTSTSSDCFGTVKLLISESSSDKRCFPACSSISADGLTGCDLVDDHCTPSCPPGYVLPRGQSGQRFQCGRTTDYRWTPLHRLPLCTGTTLRGIVVILSSFNTLQAID